jgi:hypothetical protein
MPRPLFAAEKKPGDTGVEIFLDRVACQGAFAVIVHEHSVSPIRVDTIRPDLDFRFLPKDFDSRHCILKNFVSAELPFTALEDANAAAMNASVNFAARQHWSCITTDTNNRTCRPAAVAV